MLTKKTRVTETVWETYTSTYTEDIPTTIVGITVVTVRTIVSYTTKWLTDIEQETTGLPETVTSEIYFTVTSTGYDDQISSAFVTWR